MKAATIGVDTNTIPSSILDKVTASSISSLSTISDKIELSAVL